MECNRDEAARAKALAERRMQEKDFVGAKKMIIKAQQLLKEVDDIDIQKMLTVCDVHCAAGAKVNTEFDWYRILQVPVNAEETLIKKQYRKLALLLHPDKNKFGGAEAAFKLVGEANITLTDQSKRSVYDMKRSTFRGIAARPAYKQTRGSSPARSNSTPVNLHSMHQQQQHQASNPSGPQTTFWTICPSCGMRYQYYLSVLKKALRCQNCLKPYIAHDIKEQNIPPGANQRSAGVWKNAGAPQNFPGPQINVTGQQGWSATPGVHVNIGSHHANVNTKRETHGNTGGVKNKNKSKRGTVNSSKPSSAAGLKRGRRAVIESSESSISETSSDSEEEILQHVPAENNADPGQQTRRSSRQKQEVKYNEESDDDVEDENSAVDHDFANSPAFKRLRKSGPLYGDHVEKTAKPNEDIAGHNGLINGLNNCSNTKDKESGASCGLKASNAVEQTKRETMHTGENSDGKGKVFHSVSNNGLGLNDDDDASDDEKFTLPDPEFYDFDQLRDVKQFRVNQIWAVYDDQGCMPRFYARILKVKTTPKFLLHFIWLEFDPTNRAEEAWSHRGLPVACGRFKHGQSDVTGETTMFSRTISFEKRKSNSYEIYPRKDEVWALFKGWDINWSSDAGNHKKINYQYEVVQVLSDLTTSTSIIVMPLVKIEGYVSLFMQSREAAPYVIPQGDTLRFSHCVPHYLMSGTEKEGGVPEGSLELDAAALPLNMGEVFPSVNPKCSSVRSQERDVKPADLSSRKSSGKVSMNVGEGQHTTCISVEIPANTPKEENNKQNTHNAEVTDVDDEDNCKVYECAASEFYEFSEIRLLQKFSPGQIWALYSDIDKFPNFYAFIQKVDLKSDKVQVRWLDVCPQGEEEKRLTKEERTIVCGTFRLTSAYEMTSYTGTDAFSHPVEARFTGKKGEYEIIPHLGEIWAVYKNWRAGWTAQDFEKCEYELVEIFGHTDSSIQVQLLRKVNGYKAVFMRYRSEGSVMTIRKDEYPKFSHQIPCFHLTHEKGGKLRGYLELDPMSLPEDFLATDSM